MTYKTEGIIIKRMNFKEADLILTVLTPDKGKVSVIAKGVRKIKSKMAGGTELFYLADFMLAEGKAFETLCSVEAKERHLFLRGDLEKLGQAYRLAEMADRFIQEGDVVPEVYRELLKAMKGVELHDCLAVRLFEVKLFSILGFGPGLDSCVACHGALSEGHCSLSRNHGGVVCRDCARRDPESYPVSDNAIKILRVMLRYDMETVFRISGFEAFLDEIGPFNEGYLEKILQRPLKSKKFMSKMATANL